MVINTICGRLPKKLRRLILLAKKSDDYIIAQVADWLRNGGATPAELDAMIAELER